jgi:N-acyl-D-amino-acid deacylase
MQLELSTPLLTMIAFAFATLAATSALFAADTPTSQATILRGGTVYDGSGAPGFKADVLIVGDTVKEIGPDLKANSARVLDVTDLAVCPGIIDVHQHAHEWIERSGLAPKAADFGNMEEVVQQGITTTVGGMDGSGELDLVKYAGQLAADPASPNICRLVGHSAARDAVIPHKRGEAGRKATPGEIRKMAALIEQGMKDGAFGFSSGLEYLGDYVTTEEMIALAKAVAPYGGYYETHLRNEDVTVFEATEEAIRICREGGNIPLSISHIKVGSYEVWHQAWRLEMIMDEARARGLQIYANWRPSINWQSDLKGYLDPKNTGDLKVIDAELHKYWPKADAYCFACKSHPELAGKTLDKIAASWNITPAEAIVKIWGFGDAKFEFDAKRWEDKRVFLNDPWCMVASDGADAPSPGRPDPLIWNCFPIFFGHVVRDWKWYPMETAVFKCTGLPAEMLGLKDRGMLKAGMKADVFVFDPKTIHGEEHWDKADVAPTGVAYTIVNGVVVMDHGKHTGARPGIFIRKR